MTETAGVRPPGLWVHADFLKLWAGQTISQIGSQVTVLALPLTAVLLLHASALQVGVMGAVQFAPFLLLGLVAGVAVDRFPRRPLLIGADVGRALILALVPALALLGHLSMPYLYVIAFVAGCLTLLFDVSYQAYLPGLVSPDQISDGNAKLETSRSASVTIGPAIAGVLVQAFTAAVAIAVDAASYVASAVSLVLIRAPEQPPAQRRDLGVFAALLEGLRFVLRNPVLRPIALATGTSNLFINAVVAILVLYLVRGLSLPPVVIGLALSAASVAGVVTAFRAAAIGGRIGIGPTLVLCVGSMAAGILLVGLASFGGPVRVAFVFAGQLLAGSAVPVYNVTQVSLRQRITPPDMQGRMNATMRFVVWGTIPAGMLLGGLLGQRLGLAPTVLLSGTGVAVPWLAFAPFVRSRTLAEVEQLM